MNSEAPVGRAVEADGREAALSRDERRVFAASVGGTCLDGMDSAFYGLIVPSLIAVWGISRAEAGAAATTMLLAAAAGGWLAGILSDRFGRLKILQVTILWFAVFSLLSALAANLPQLTLARACAALGFGGEIAVSIALIGEISRPQNRATLLGLMHSSFSIGGALAAILFWLCSLLLPPEHAWRGLLAIGVIPAFLVLYIRRRVPDVVTRSPAVARGALRQSMVRIFAAGQLRGTLLGSVVAAGTLAGINGVQIWLPTYLRTVRGLSLGNTTINVVLYQVSHFLGYLVGGYLADRIGRRVSFVTSSLLSLASILAYTMLDVDSSVAVILNIPLGFFTATIYGGMAALFNEMFPSEVRGSGVAFCYNSGKAFAAFAPTIISLWGQVLPLGTAISAFSVVAYLSVVAAAVMIPETRGARLSHQCTQPRGS